MEAQIAPRPREPGMVEAVAEAEDETVVELGRGPWQDPLWQVLVAHWSSVEQVAWKDPQVVMVKELTP